MGPIITSNPRVLHGEPCFAGTRLLLQTFFGHLEAGYTAAGFLEQFPTVRREQVAGLLAELRAAPAASSEAWPPAVTLSACLSGGIMSLEATR